MGFPGLQCRNLQNAMGDGCQLGIHTVTSDLELHPLMFREFEMDSETVFLPRTWATGSTVRNAAVRCCSSHADFCRLPPRSSSPTEKKGQFMIKLTDYVKTAEAAEILGVSQNTLRKWAASGAIPMHRNPANGYRLFKRSDLDAFLRRAGTPVRTTKRKPK